MLKRKWVSVGLLAAVSMGCASPTGEALSSQLPLSSSGGTTTGANEPAPPPERYDVARLAGNLGMAFVQGNDLFQEEPGKAPKRLLNFPMGTSIQAVEPHLRYVLLHERYNFLNVQQLGDLPQPMPIQVPPDPGSRLVYQSLENGERRILLPHFYHYDGQVAIAPDGQTLAVRAQLEPGPQDAQNIYLLDVASAELSPFLLGRRAFQFAWSPDGSCLAIIGAANVQARTDLSVVDRQTKTLRTLKALENGGGNLLWIGNNRLFHFDSTRGIVALEGLAGSSEAFELDLASALHMAFGEVSPDETQVLGTVYLERAQPRSFVLSLTERRWRLLAEGERWPRWEATGAKLVCGETRSAAAEECRVEP